MEGVKRAFDSGFRHVAVSAAGFQAKATSEISDIAAGVGLDVLVFSVCNTCVGKMGVEHITRADVVCASASKIVRRKIGSKALLQSRVTIPVYALTEKGKQLILAYLVEFGDKLAVSRTSSLLYLAENRSPILKCYTEGLYKESFNKTVYLHRHLVLTLPKQKMI